MKLSVYLEKLQKILKESGDLEVIYSRDDEGNGFEKVHYDPTVGFFDGDDFEDEESTENDSNSICIN